MSGPSLLGKPRLGAEAATGRRTVGEKTIADLPGGVIWTVEE
jgi:hypothetical protein